MLRLCQNIFKINIFIDYGKVKFFFKNENYWLISLYENNDKALWMWPLLCWIWMIVLWLLIHSIIHTSLLWWLCLSCVNELKIFDIRQNTLLWHYIYSILCEICSWICWALLCLGCIIVHNTLRPRQNGCHFLDDIFKCIFLNENIYISIKISLKVVPQGPINNIPGLIQIMAWRLTGDKPLSEPILA